ncbi:hypothetical protein E2C01_065801 [Portunus trituberculatus]|uniref:Uncharacterized protein n=1 Tax=Portunus trituberculatus TaxID=210409 RepID=A0A5B7HSU0_PORTR|nr:hypothetical protein [Portunus trituberculatus]
MRGRRKPCAARPQEKGRAVTMRITISAVRKRLKTVS